MSCCDIEKLINFALEPLSEKNAETAAHVAVCPKCREEYALALESVQQDNIFINDADREEARCVTAEMLENASGSIRFGNMFQNLLDMIRNKVVGTAASQFSTAQSAVFGAAPAPSVGAPRRVMADPKITFESCCGKESQYYWKMQMTLPVMVTESSRIMLKVVNAENRAVANGGMLLFLGKKIPINAGLASIPLKLFLERTCSKDENTVRFMFADSVISRGTIKFLPEAI